MRKLVAIAIAAVALGALAPSATATGTSVDQPSAGAQVFAGGGTLFSNGLFFPGTVLKDDTVGQQGMPPVEVAKGTDFEFVNLDEGVVANGHKLQSFKRKKGRPLFMSKFLDTPGETSLVVTSHLKPGVYEFYCVQHAGMYGHIQIVKN